MEELYHLRDDPQELHNLAENPRYHDRRDTLAAALDSWIAATGDVGVLPEDKLVARIRPGRTTAVPTSKIEPVESAASGEPWRA